jgi:prevent-host-death family protein
VTTVPSDELRSRLNKYLQLVRDGEFVRVTDRGEPVAVIVPLKNSPTPVIEELFKRGGITFGTGQPLSQAAPARLKPGKSIAAMVAEDRRQARSQQQGRPAAGNSAVQI